jgi:hypothetical protein
MPALLEQRVPTSGPQRLALGWERRRRVLRGHRDRQGLGRLLDRDRDGRCNFDGGRVYSMLGGKVHSRLGGRFRATARALFAVALAFLGRAFAGGL